ncbi:MAG: NRDE family protein [Thermoguttaceae bacterium]
MGILAVQYQTIRDAPLLIAFNREEQLDRPSQPPKIQSGRPRVVCGVDRQAGGTWAGVNQHGLFCGVVNAPKRHVPFDARSRGLLCKDLLGCKDAEEARDLAQHELLTGNYAGGHFLCIDRFSGYVVSGLEDVEVEKLNPGLHVLSENRLDDPHDQRQEFVRRMLTLQRLDTAVMFLAVASRTFSRKPDVDGKRGILVLEPRFATVSSLLLSLTEKTARSIMQFASGLPGDNPYEDVSALLRQVLSTDRANQRVAAAKIAKSAEAAELHDEDVDDVDADV